MQAARLGSSDDGLSVDLSEEEKKEDERTQSNRMNAEVIRKAT